MLGHNVSESGGIPYQIGFLQQNAYDDTDAYCTPEKQFKMMKMFVQYHQEALKSLRNSIPLAKLRSMQVISKMLRSKFAIKNELKITE